VAIHPEGARAPGVIAAGLLGLFLVQSATIVVRGALLNVSGERMAAQMRKDLFKHILAQDMAWFDRHRTGDVITRLSNDTGVIQKALTSNVASGLRSAFMVAGGTGMLFYLSPYLALLSLSLIPPVAIAGMAYGTYVQGQQRAVQEAVGRTMEVAEELVGSVRTVRQFAREAPEAARFAARVEESFQLARRRPHMPSSTYDCARSRSSRRSSPPSALQPSEACSILSRHSRSPSRPTRSTSSSTRSSSLGARWASPARRSQRQRRPLARRERCSAGHSSSRRTHSQHSCARPTSSRRHGGA
jgi:ABC-type multidrug transport system fused ATPase/permease subunit